jgi:hypothetical protein
MGVICQKCINRKELKEESIELKFPDYKSSQDEIFSKIEKKYNPLEYFQLYSFILLLNNINVTENQENLDHYQASTVEVKAEISDLKVVKREHLQELSKEEFIVFVGNKILKHFLVATIIKDIEDYPQIYQDYSTELYGSLMAARSDLEKRKNNGVKVKKPKAIKKLYLFPYALLFCNCNAEGKLELLFSLFGNDKKEFALCSELEDFLYFLFITPSFCSFRAIKRIAEKYPTQFQAISAQDYVNKTDAYEVEDVLRLREIFIRDFFGGKTALTRKEYDDKFLSGLFWIFSPSGIRLNLEKNNVPKQPVQA